LFLYSILIESTAHGEMVYHLHPDTGQASVQLGASFQAWATEKVT
jgi:hypothetical protein